MDTELGLKEIWKDETLSQVVFGIITLDKEYAYNYGKLDGSDALSDVLSERILSEIESYFEERPYIENNAGAELLLNEVCHELEMYSDTHLVTAYPSIEGIESAVQNNWSLLEKLKTMFFWGYSWYVDQDTHGDVYCENALSFLTRKIG